MIVGIRGGGAATVGSDCRHASHGRFRAARVRAERPAPAEPAAFVGAVTRPARAPLEDIPRPEAPLPAPARAAAAARAFAAGNGYLTGLLVDRTI